MQPLKMRKEKREDTGRKTDEKRKEETFPAIVRKVKWPGSKKVLGATFGSIIAAAAVGGILSAYCNLIQTLVGRLI